MELAGWDTKSKHQQNFKDSAVKPFLALWKKATVFLLSKIFDWLKTEELNWNSCEFLIFIGFHLLILQLQTTSISLDLYFIIYISLQHP